MKTTKLPDSKESKWKKIILSIFVFAVFLPSLYAQYGEIKGSVLDDKTKNPIPFANVIVETEGAQIGGCTTDFEGRYSIKSLGPGVYDIKVSYVGYRQVLMKKVRVNAGKITFQDIQMTAAAVSLETVEIMEYKVPMIMKDHTSSSATITSEEIAKMPCRSADGPSKTVGGVFSADGERGSVRGASIEKTISYVDGIKVEDPASPPLVLTTETKGEKGRPTVAEASLPDLRPGTLTAGEVDDFNKWVLWEDVAKDKLSEYKATWKIHPGERYAVQVVTGKGRPVIDAVVKLLRKDKELVWTAHTDNTGKAELWNNMFEDAKPKKSDLSILVTYKGNTYESTRITSFDHGLNMIELPVDCDIPSSVQAVFMVDATGSMAHELEYLKVEMNDIIAKVKTLHSDVNIELGSVFYRDHGDSYVMKKSDFSTDINNTVNFIKAQSAGGGGDYPEAVDEALKMSVDEMNWNDNALARLLFLVLDAPPHNSPENIASLQKTVNEAAAKGIRIVPIVCGGIDKSTEYLMRSWALATNGTYVFLTDHSGVGGTHLKPTTDQYNVEMLNGLIIRLFDQYLYAPPCDHQLLVKHVNPADTIGIVKNDIIDHVIIDTTAITKLSITPFMPDTNRISFVHPGIPYVNPDKQPTDTTNNTAGSNLLITPFTTFPNTTLFRYYPNPTAGHLHIEVSSGMKELFLTDIGGKLLERYELAGQESLDINIGRYPAGIYFLKCGDKTGKVVLER